MVAPLDPVPTGDRVLTVPNLLSLLRLLGVPVFLYLALGPEADGWAVALLMASGISDYLDGVLARKLNQVSRLGALLDPLADRLYILATVVALTVRGILPLWVTLVLVARDLFMTGLLARLRRHGYGPLAVHYLGKAATFNLLYALPLLLLGDGDGDFARTCQVLGWAFAGWGVGLYWWAAILYARQVTALVRVAAQARTG